jgi:N-acetylmuramoyl-L-alanine amidase
MKIIERPSPNFNERVGEGVPDILLLHYTGMQSCAAAVERLTSAEARVSAHYTVDEDGTVYAHVPEHLRAWHAGVSSWRGHSDINSRAVGIEIVNCARPRDREAPPDPCAQRDRAFGCGARAQGRSRRTLSMEATSR